MWGTASVGYSQCGYSQCWYSQCWYSQCWYSQCWYSHRRLEAARILLWRESQNRPCSERATDLSIAGCLALKKLALKKLALKRLAVKLAVKKLKRLIDEKGLLCRVEQPAKGQNPFVDHAAVYTSRRRLDDGDAEGNGV